MKIEGDFEVEAPRGEVWEKIRDPQVMGASIPGCAQHALMPAR